MKTYMKILVTIEIDSIIRPSEAQQDEILRHCLHDTEYNSYKTDRMSSYRTVEIKREIVK